MRRCRVVKTATPSTPPSAALQMQAAATPYLQYLLGVKEEHQPSTTEEGSTTPTSSSVFTNAAPKVLLPDLTSYQIHRFRTKALSPKKQEDDGSSSSSRGHTITEKGKHHHTNGHRREQLKNGVDEEHEESDDQPLQVHLRDRYNFMRDRPFSDPPPLKRTILSQCEGLSAYSFDHVLQLMMSRRDMQGACDLGRHWLLCNATFPDPQRSSEGYNSDKVSGDTVMSTSSFDLIETTLITRLVFVFAQVAAGQEHDLLKQQLQEKGEELEKNGQKWKKGGRGGEDAANRRHHQNRQQSQRDDPHRHVEVSAAERSLVNFINKRITPAIPRIQNTTTSHPKTILDPAHLEFYLRIVAHALILFARPHFDVWERTTNETKAAKLAAFNKALANMRKLYARIAAKTDLSRLRNITSPGGHHRQDVPQEIFNTMIPVVLRHGHRSNYLVWKSVYDRRQNLQSFDDSGKLSPSRSRSSTFMSDVACAWLVQTCLDMPALPTNDGAVSALDALQQHPSVSQRFLDYREISMTGRGGGTSALTTKDHFVEFASTMRLSSVPSAFEVSTAVEQYLRDFAQGLSSTTTSTSATTLRTLPLSVFLRAATTLAQQGKMDIIHTLDHDIIPHATPSVASLCSKLIVSCISRGAAQGDSVGLFRQYEHCFQWLGSGVQRVRVFSALIRDQDTLQLNNDVDDGTEAEGDHHQQQRVAPMWWGYYLHHNLYIPSQLVRKMIASSPYQSSEPLSKAASEEEAAATPSRTVIVPAPSATAVNDFDFDDEFGSPVAVALQAPTTPGVALENESNKATDGDGEQEAKAPTLLPTASVLACADASTVVTRNLLQHLASAALFANAYSNATAVDINSSSPSLSCSFAATHFSALINDGSLSPSTAATTRLQVAKNVEDIVSTILALRIKLVEDPDHQAEVARGVLHDGEGQQYGNSEEEAVTKAKALQADVDIDKYFAATPFETSVDHSYSAVKLTPLETGLGGPPKKKQSNKNGGANNTTSNDAIVRVRALLSEAECGHLLKIFAHLGNTTRILQVLGFGQAAQLLLSEEKLEREDLQIAFSREDIKLASGKVAMVWSVLETLCFYVVTNPFAKTSVGLFQMQRGVHHGERDIIVGHRGSSDCGASVALQNEITAFAIIRAVVFELLNAAPNVSFSFERNIRISPWASAAQALKDELQYGSSTVGSSGSFSGSEAEQALDEMLDNDVADGSSAAVDAVFNAAMDAQKLRRSERNRKMRGHQSGRRHDISDEKKDENSKNHIPSRSMLDRAIFPSLQVTTPGSASPSALNFKHSTSQEINFAVMSAAREKDKVGGAQKRNTAGLRTLNHRGSSIARRALNPSPTGTSSSSSSRADGGANNFMASTAMVSDFDI